MANLVNTTVTGNVIVTQNTSTGNLSITTLANVATLNVATSANVAKLNVLSTISANASPLVNTATQVPTVISGYHTVASSVISSTALAVDNYLTLTFNETGYYEIEALMLVCGNVGGNGFGGFQFDLGANTATIANLAYATMGFSNLAITTTAVTVNNTVGYTTSNVASNNTSPSWFSVKGTATITSTGTWGVRWAQGASSPNAITMMQGSFFKATKHR